MDALKRPKGRPGAPGAPGRPGGAPPLARPGAGRPRPARPGAQRPGPQRPRRPGERPDPRRPRRPDDRRPSDRRRDPRDRDDVDVPGPRRPRRPGDRPDPRRPRRPDRPDPRRPRRDRDRPRDRNRDRRPEERKKKPEESKDARLARIIARIRPRLARVLDRGIRRRLLSPVLAGMRLWYRLTALDLIGKPASAIRARLNPEGNSNQLSELTTDRKLKIVFDEIERFRREDPVHLADVSRTQLDTVSSDLVDVRGIRNLPRAPGRTPRLASDTISQLNTPSGVPIHAVATRIKLLTSRIPADAPPVIRQAAAGDLTAVRLITWGDDPQNPLAALLSHRRGRGPAGGHLTPMERSPSTGRFERVSGMQEFDKFEAVLRQNPKLRRALILFQRGRIKEAVALASPTLSPPELAQMVAVPLVADALRFTFPALTGVAMLNAAGQRQDPASVMRDLPGAAPGSEEAGNRLARHLRRLDDDDPQAPRLDDPAANNPLREQSRRFAGQQFFRDRARRLGAMPPEERGREQERESALSREDLRAERAPQIEAIRTGLPSAHSLAQQVMQALRVAGLLDGTLAEQDDLAQQERVFRAAVRRYLEDQMRGGRRGR